MDLIGTARSPLSDQIPIRDQALGAILSRTQTCVKIGRCCDQNVSFFWGHRTFDLIEVISDLLEFAILNPDPVTSIAFVQEDLRRVHVAIGRQPFRAAWTELLILLLRDDFRTRSGRVFEAMEDQPIVKLNELLQFAFIEPNAAALWAVIEIDIAKEKGFHRNSAIGTKTSHNSIVVARRDFGQGLIAATPGKPRQKTFESSKPDPRFSESHVSKT